MLFLFLISVMALQPCNVFGDIQIQSIGCDLGLVDFGEDIECQTAVSFTGYTNDTITNSSIIVNTFHVMDSTNKLTPFCYNPKITYQHILIKPDYNSTLDVFETITDNIDIYEGNLGDLSHPISTCDMVDVNMNDSCSWGTCIMKQTLEKEYIDFAGINITIYAEPDYYFDECEYNQECEFCNITSTLTLTCSKNEQIFICNDERNCSNTNVDIIDNIPFYLYCGAMSCTNMIVNGNNAYDIHIKCYGYMSCSNMIINGYNAKHITIKCHDDNACLNMILNGNNVHESNVLCHINSCLNVIINHMYSENITIQCYGDSSCFNMTIQTSNTQSFKLYCMDDVICDQFDSLCSGHAICDNLYIDANYVNSIDVQCAQQECSNFIISALHAVQIVINGFVTNATINAPYATNTQLKCNTDNSCINLTIKTNNAAKISADCRGNNSCSNMVINAHNIYTIDTHCHGHNSCSQLLIHAGNGSNVEIACTGYNTCFNGIVNASQTENIKLICNGICNNLYMNGQYAQYVSIYCNLPHGCSHLYIVSSFARRTKIEASKSLINSIFHVENVYALIFSGVGDYISDNVTIYASNSDSIIMDMMGYRTFLNSVIYAQNTEDIKIVIDGDYAADNMTIYASNSDSIIMDMMGYRTFLNSVIYAQNTEDIKIVIDGDYAADNMTIYGEHSGFLQINAKGKRSFTNSSVHGHNVNKLDITCFSELFDGEACLNTNIYLSSKYQSNTFFCRFGCQRLNLYFEDNIAVSIFDTITFGECALSQYVNQFIDEWVLYYHAYYIDNNIKNYTLSTIYQGYYNKHLINNEG
eukprot:67515_1